jgi:hypothetical protein
MAGYITLSEVRAQGLTTAQASDAEVNAAIDATKQLVDELTGQWFESRALTMLLDGNDTSILHLPVPVIGLTSLFINGDFDNAADPDSYRVYNRTFPDDRRNPKIALFSEEERVDIFTPASVRERGPAFVFGKQNQKLVGTFGFVETGGLTPALIKRAQMKLVMKFVSKLGPGSASLGAPLGPVGPVTTEMTDGHMQVFGPTMKALTKPGTLALTGDPEVEEILKLYRRPIGYGVPKNAVWASG